MSNPDHTSSNSPRQLSILEVQFNERIRHTIHEGVEYFSLVDIMSEFSDLESRPDVLWKRIKERLETEGFSTRSSVIKLRLIARDGKLRKTDCADAKTCLRIIQSIPSERAEPIRAWLAQLGAERIEESQHPGLGTARALKRDLALLERAGYSEHEAAAHIRSRIASIEGFKALSTTIAAKCANPNFGEIYNTEYLGLFNQTAAALKQILNTKSIRDKLPTMQLNALIYAESQLQLLLKQADRLTSEQVCDIARRICFPIGKQLQEICDLLGIDLVTGVSLLKG